MEKADFKRVAALFDRARELSGAERRAWLDAETADAPEVRGEVERLLKIHDTDGEALDGLGAVYREALDDLAGDGSPERVGPYQILEELGQGGMGVVYLAEQQEPLERKVALKIIRLGMNSAEVVARFERERQTLARLVHPGIAQVYDAGTTEDGRPFFALEYVDGEPITSFCDARRMRIADRIALFRDVCRAVEHAHQKGIIHRDLKPSNVLVTEIDGKPVVKVIDFGIAKAVDDRESDRTELTAFGSMIGTPAYMSPEQAIGDGHDLDTRTDIYSLGAVLYELFVGALPIDADTLRRAGPVEMVRMLAQDEPPTPSTRAEKIGRTSTIEAEARQHEPGTWVRRLRGDLDWITMKALEKDRARRYRSAGALEQDLGRFLANEPIEARPPSRAYRFKKLAQRNVGLLVAASVVFVTLIAGLIVSTNLFFDAEDARELAETRLADIERTADRQILTRLEAEADTLWPALPHRADAMRDWLRRADALLERRTRYEARLEGLRASGTPVPRGADDETVQALDELRRAELAMIRNKAAYAGGSQMDVALPPEKRPLTYYFTTAFELDAVPDAPLPYRLHAFDGVILYVNGNEIDRVNLPAEGVDASTPTNGPPPPSTGIGTVPPEHLVAGSNVIAAEVHLRSRDRPRLQLTFDLSGPGGTHLVPLDAEWLVAPPGTTLDDGWPSRAVDDTWSSYTGPPGFTDVEKYPESARGYLGHMNAELARLRAAKAPLEAELAERTAWRFDVRADQDEHDELTGLVDALEAFATEGGPRADVAARLEHAETIATKSIDEHRAAWARAVADVGSAETYDGLELTPQVGLVPLGPDPASGLQEFAEIATGDIPERASDGTLVITDDTGVVLVLVPGGTFHLGAVRPRGPDDEGPNRDPRAERSEGPVHVVSLDPYFLSKYEMTQGQWLRVTGTNPSGWPVGREAQGKTATLRNPVDGVPWHDVKAGLARVGLILPTEAQWEYAVRAGTDTPWWCGSTPEDIKGFLNIADMSVVRNKEAWAEKAWKELDDGYVVHAPAGTFPANPWGFHETLGNVREWCLDRFGTYHAPFRDGDGLRMEFYEPDLIITRGGTYSSRLATCRVAYRGRTKAQVADSWVGIRPARALDTR